MARQIDERDACLCSNVTKLFIGEVSILGIIFKSVFAHLFDDGLD